MKRLYITIISVFALFLFGCSSSYRSMQTTDDVYYSPDQNNDGYVGNESSEDADSYAYRNSLQSGLYPSMGLWGSPYGSFLNFNLTFGSPYYSLFNPVYSPYLGFGGYYNYMNPFAFGSYLGFGYPFGYSNLYNPFMSYGYFPYSGYSYSPFSYYSHGFYGQPYWLGTGIVKNNGPRITSATNYLGRGLLLGNTDKNVLRPATAPVRTFTTNNNSGIIQRNIPVPRMESGRANTRAERRAIRRFNSAQENPDRGRSIFTPSERGNFPERKVNTSPVRTFERPASVPERVIQSTPPVRSGGGGTPIRKF